MIRKVAGPHRQWSLVKWQGNSKIWKGDCSKRVLSNLSSDMDHSKALPEGLINEPLLLLEAVAQNNNDATLNKGPNMLILFDDTDKGPQNFGPVEASA